MLIIPNINALNTPEISGTAVNIALTSGLDIGKGLIKSNVNNDKESITFTEYNTDEEMRTILFKDLKSINLPKILYRKSR
ncbi:hypothetical protein BFU36_12985 [Sulfolobus sp. A20]|nr:hypothetical protein BFU36_12985 [Sulfolobus sp. A20]TRM86078.1 hypothetical protein DJ521_06360 [Sulfolobus sp. E3]